MEIWEKLKELGESIPAEEWNDLPRDLSQNFERYQMEQQNEELGIPKTKRLESKKWLKQIRSMECLFCEEPTTAEPHHIRKYADAGTSQTPSDFYAIPICRYHHDLAQKYHENDYNRIAFPAAIMLRWLDDDGYHDFLRKIMREIGEFVFKEIEK